MCQMQCSLLTQLPVDANDRDPGMTSLASVFASLGWTEKIKNFKKSLKNKVSTIENEKKIAKSWTVKHKDFFQPNKILEVTGTLSSHYHYHYHYYSIDHFTVVCSVTWPLDESESGAKIDLIENLNAFLMLMMLFSC